MKHAAVIILLLVLVLSGCAHFGSKEPRIIDTRLLKDGEIMIVWLSRKSTDYEILSTLDPNLDEAEWKVEAVVTAESSKTTSWTDSGVAQGKQKFYRVRKVEGSD